MQPIECNNCWRNMPIFNRLFLIVSSSASFGLTLACLIDTGRFNCYLFNYLSLWPYKTYEKFEFWRIVSPYFFTSNFWGILWVGLSVFMYGVPCELALGTKRYVALMGTCLLLNSLLVSAFAAFFGAIPGINSWIYFRNMWRGAVMVGATPVVIYSYIFHTRQKGDRTAMCCMFAMPVWAFSLILFFMSQIMMYPPWEGIWYNVCPFIIGFLLPKSFLGESQYQPINLAAEMNKGAEAGRGPQGQFTSFNSAAEKRAEDKAPKPKFSGKGRSL